MFAKLFKSVGSVGSVKTNLSGASARKHNRRMRLLAAAAMPLIFAATAAQADFRRAADNYQFYGGTQVQAPAPQKAAGFTTDQLHMMLTVAGLAPETVKLSDGRVIERIKGQIELNGKTAPCYMGIVLTPNHQYVWLLSNLTVIDPNQITTQALLKILAANGNLGTGQFRLDGNTLQYVLPVGVGNLSAASLRNVVNGFLANITNTQQIWNVPAATSTAAVNSDESAPAGLNK